MLSVVVFPIEKNGVQWNQSVFPREKTCLYGDIAVVFNISNRKKSIYEKVILVSKRKRLGSSLTMYLFPREKIMLDPILARFGFPREKTYDQMNQLYPYFPRKNCLQQNTKEACFPREKKNTSLCCIICRKQYFQEKKEYFSFDDSYLLIIHSASRQLVCVLPFQRTYDIFILNPYVLVYALSTHVSQRVFHVFFIYIVRIVNQTHYRKALKLSKVREYAGE